MGYWLRGLVAIACLVVIAAGSTFVYFQVFPRAGGTRLVATTRQIEKCEKVVTGATLHPRDEEYPEMSGRMAAVAITECEDYGLLSPNSKAAILRSKLAPFLEAYQANRAVWVK